MPKHQNENYQEIWDKYVKENKCFPTVLLPLSFGMDKNGIYRTRIKAGDVKEIWAGIKDKFPAYMRARPDMFDNPDLIFSKYIEHFEKMDGENSDVPRTPLDLSISHPTWLMFVIDTPNWKFCKHGAEYSVENDMDDLTRNFEKVALFDNPTLTGKDPHGNPKKERKILILSNRNRSAPKNLKYNLHVDVLQVMFKGTKEEFNASTTIIIDPGGGQNPNPPFGNGGD